MAKKKNSRQKHQKDVSFADTSEEELNDGIKQGKCCPHISRGINFGRIKKSLKASENINVCSGCDDTNKDDDPPEVWLCLQCGYRGCGRMSSNKHGLQHFRTIHSDCHSLVLSSSSGVVWCYDCDDEVPLQVSRNLRQCVEFIMKLKGNKPNLKSADEKTDTHENLQESAVKEMHPKFSEEPVRDSKSSKTPKNNAKSNISVSKSSIKGLRNLGNTCFFNAVMQNLAQTYLLYQELEDSCNPDFVWEVPRLTITNDIITEDVNNDVLKLILPRQFPLANSLLNFFKKMYAPSTSKVEVINPSALFGEISKKSPQFQHFQQQDSHELLRQLLDGIRQEEIKRQKKAILKWFNLENTNPEKVDDEMKKLIKAYGCYASHTLVEKIFGGLLISTVLCEDCKMSSQVFEPFMDLSLPLFEEKLQENSEKFCPLLDGGKQVDVKPCRNRKTDHDSDDNDNSEYAIRKSKLDSEKPSKHQERKLKQIAKKEKKRAKNIKTQKVLGNQNDEDSTQKENIVNEDQDASADEQADDTEQKADSTQYVQENIDLTESKEIVKQSCENLQSDKISGLVEHGELLNQETKDVNVRNLKSQECNETDFIGENHTKGSSLSFTVNVDNSTECNNDLLQPANEEMDESADVVKEFFDLHSNHETISDTENQESLKIGSCEENSITIEKQMLGNQDNDITKDIMDSNVVKDLDEINGEVMRSIQASVNSDVDEKEGCKILSSHEIISDLAENFKDNLTISGTDSVRLDERIHELSMQIKDVRIRRDSDRQENILNSSESADGYESQKTNFTSQESFVEDTGSTGTENWSHSLSETQTKEWILKSLTTVKPRNHVSPLECSINSCLSHFTKSELLTGSNKFRCENCTEARSKKSGTKEIAYTNASKQLLIFSPPAILTLHLKRFQQVGMSLRKVNRFVEFPLILDIAPFCSSACMILPHMVSAKDEILYKLYGIVEHSGRLTSGHYAAYVKISERTLSQTFISRWPLAQCDLEQLLHKFSRINSLQSESSEEVNCSESRQWYYISDSHVKEVSEAQVLKCQAYLLFYERIK